jgi:NTP pyrophosphatase (non-canonical NTP hydrolase)
MNENVNHPNHYNIPGRKECIVEMVEKFGTEAVEIFCVLNAYKYRYRHELKNGQEDLDKAAWYDDFASLMRKNSDKTKIAEHYGWDGQTQQLIEEMAELTQAICKEKRSRGQGQTLGEGWKFRDVHANLIEEIADVKLTLDEVMILLDADDAIRDIMQEKIKRTFERMGDEK